MSYRKALFVFRRDLRLQDNVGLSAALDASETVAPVFIFDDRQVGDQNAYRSAYAVQFMLESLDELHKALRQKESQLYCFHGKPDAVVKMLIEQESIDAVYLNADYTPFSQQRDEAIRTICRQQGVAFHAYHDVTLHRPGDVLKDDGKPYTVYTPFYKKARTLDVSQPQKNLKKNYYQGNIKGADVSLLKAILPAAERTDTLAISGGRSVALKILRELNQLKDYQENRDFPAKEATSKLSAHHKFGTVSQRESFWMAVNEFGEDHHFIREIYWREFFTHIAFHHPYVFGQCFYPKYDALQWDNQEAWFHAWCEGRTGFPIVDAGMRELNTTGYMHNRVRMITAAFLTKDLHIDWRWGEQYFAQQLVDYDPAVNNGSWQWAASTGCDAAPYFRIFNPWLQQKKFDPDCAYIKKWIPALHGLDTKTIHAWHEGPFLFNKCDYPSPIVDHHRQKERALVMFKSLKG